MGPQMDNCCKGSAIFSSLGKSASLDGKYNSMKFRAYRCMERSDTSSRTKGSGRFYMRCDEVVFQGSQPGFKGPLGYPIYVLSLVPAFLTILFGARPSRTFVLQQLHCSRYNGMPDILKRCRTRMVQLGDLEIEFCLEPGRDLLIYNAR